MRSHPCLSTECPHFSKHAKGRCMPSTQKQKRASSCLEGALAWKLLTKRTFASPFARLHGGRTVCYPISQHVAPKGGVFFSGPKYGNHITSGGPDSVERLDLCVIQLHGRVQPLSEPGGVCYGLVVPAITNLGPASLRNMCGFLIDVDADRCNDAGVLAKCMLRRISNPAALDEIVGMCQSKWVLEAASNRLEEVKAHA